MRLPGLEEFAQVAEEGNFSAAAERLGVSKSFVSNQVRRLEERLQARLFQRTTRKVRLTDTGEMVFARAKQLVEDMEDLELSTQVMQVVPRGHLSISVPPWTGERFIGPVVARYMSDYPSVTVDISSSPRWVDLIDEGFDLAVRFTPTPDEGLVARKLADSRLELYASRTYLEKFGTPRSPDELGVHRCITFGQHGSRAPSIWHFKRASDGATAQARVVSSWRCNTPDGMIVGALAGLGLLYAPDFIVRHVDPGGELVPVMSEWCHAPNACWIVFAHRRYMSSKVRGLVDRIVEAFRPDPPWAQGESTAT